MSWKRTTPLGIGIVLVILAIGVAAVAMFATDNGEELVHLYRDVRGTPGNNTAAGPGEQTSASPMELQGLWQGMSLVSVDGPLARSLGVKAPEGVVVADLPKDSERFQQSGVRRGDVIVSVDRKPVRDLASLRNVTQTVALGSPVLLDVQRYGQPMTLVLPAALPPGPVGQPGQWGGQPGQPGQWGGQPGQPGQWGGQPGQPGQWGGQPGQPGRGWGAEAPEGRGAWTPAAWQTHSVYCPHDGLTLPSSSVAPPYLCPRCGRAMHWSTRR